MPKPTVKTKTGAQIEVLYPTVKSIHAFDGGDAPPLDAAWFIKALGWKSEKQWLAEQLAKDPSFKAEEHGYGDDYLYESPIAGKVRCINNGGNRPFDDGTRKRYTQDLLNRKWAGPMTYPGETVNGEPLIISRTGKTVSMQHRGCALIEADLLWHQQPDHWKPKWPTPPVMEAIVVVGISDAPRVLATLDNVRTRSAGDTFAAQGMFADLPRKDRVNACRYLDKALAILWRRTGAAEAEDNAIPTNAALNDFFEHHKRVERCVRHVMRCNQGKDGSEHNLLDMDLQLSLAAAALFLMATDGSDVDEYRNPGKDGYRSEKKLVWDSQERAEKFFTDLAEEKLLHIKAALDQHDKGELAAWMKLAILARAWAVYRTSGKPDAMLLSDVQLRFTDYGPDGRTDKPLELVLNDKGKYYLAEEVSFGGIDLGDKPSSEDEPDTEEVKQAMAKEATEKVDAHRNGKKGKNGEKAAPKKTMEQQLVDVRKECPNRILLFRGEQNMVSYAEDADTLAKLLGIKLEGKPDEPLRKARFPLANYESNKAKLKAAKKKLALVIPDPTGGMKVEEVQ